MPTLAHDAGTRAVRAVQDFRQAEQECAAVVGSTLGMDSAAEVYSAGLSALGVDADELAATGGTAALRTAFLARRRSGAGPRVALDSKTVKARTERFPNGGRLK